MNDQPTYPKEFYKQREEGSLSSAKVIVPLVIKLTNPKSVVDVGCGTGTFLSVFKEQGIETLLGLDGKYIDQNALLIPKENFVEHDLRHKIKITKQFDLVVSLEVAEHLPENIAEDFVHSLTSLGSVILFSAAIPHQGGTHHINEQWPKYWAEKFKTKDYVLIDCIRPKVWDNEEVSSWYAQNSFVYVHKDHLDKHLILKTELENNPKPNLSLVHPRLFSKKYEQSRLTYIFKKIAKLFKK